MQFDLGDLFLTILLKDREVNGKLARGEGNRRERLGAGEPIGLYGEREREMRDGKELGAKKKTDLRLLWRERCAKKKIDWGRE